MMIAGATSCKAPEKVTYFQDIQNQEIIRTVKAQEFTIQPGNRLSIIVKSSDPEVSALFNLPIYSTRVGAGAYRAGSMGPINYSSVGNDGIAVYNVDPEGKIDFPLLGQLKVGGMTNTELAGFIKGELMGRELVKDPTVSVSILGNAVNILGEIRSPGRYEINKAGLTLLEAIALAGDLNITGLRDKVHVIRTVNGETKDYIVDLTDAKGTFSSPAFYLQPDDVIYIEPNDMRKRQTTINGNSALSVSFWISVASLITTAVTTVGVFVAK